MNLAQVKLTMLLALVAVPVNTVFGIVAAIQLTRNEFWGKTFVMSMLDLPFSISPVVTGALLLVNTETGLIICCNMSMLVKGTANVNLFQVKRQFPYAHVDGF